jgi:two-component system NtrC family sensor kinase
VFYTAEGKQVLGLAKAIYNEESCSAASCHFHPASFKVLGILDIIVSLEEMNAQLIAYRNKIIILTATLLIIISFSMAIFMQKFVNSPVKQLLKHTQKLAQGELGSGVQFASNDELGELASSFNVMSQNLMKARDELEDWGNRLEVKVAERTRELTNIQTQLIRSEKLASLGELVAGIAHEINNPLTGILVFSSLMIDDHRLDPGLKNDLATIVRETQRCAKIVKGLLDFSRETVPQKEPASINEIMEVTLALVGNQSFFHDITISKEYASPMPKIPVDPNQIEQVFVNILLNASQAMDGNGQLQIRTGLTPDRLAAFVSITDTGCGISEEHLGKIFDPFFSTKETRGTGLGLAVSYGIIENHGGKIEVQSVVGKGSTFTVWLPLSPGVQQEITQLANL